MNESFEYSLVAAQINALDTGAVDARNALDAGTNELTTAIGPEGDALRGSAAASINQKWQELTVEFKNFTNMVNNEIANARTVAKNTEEFEANQKANVGTGTISGQ